MTKKPQSAPPKPVGERALFQVPETEQLPVGYHTYMGSCRVYRGENEGHLRFHLFRRLRKLRAAYDYVNYMPGQQVIISAPSAVPLQVNCRVRLLKASEIKAGSYRVAGSGGIKEDIANPSCKIYILERVELFRDFNYIAIHDPLWPLPDRTLVEVVRSGRDLRIILDYREVEGGAVLDRDLLLIERAAYRWDPEFGFRQIQRFTP